MKGAREYAKLFKTGQYGKLYIVSGHHARGKTFHIFILPKGVEEKDKCFPTCEDAIEVYGILCGQPGWTEEYGWLHEGKWQHDFANLVTKRRAEMIAEEKRRAEGKTKEEVVEKERIARMLADY